MRKIHFGNRLGLTMALLMMCTGTLTFSVHAQQQTGDLMTDHAILQVRLCRLMGGTGDVLDDRTPSGSSIVIVTCGGGLLSGLRCENYPSGLWHCMWRVFDPRTTTPTVPAPIDDVPLAPRSSPTATPPVSPTVLSTEPTSLPPTIVDTPVPTSVPTDVPATTVPPQKAEITPVGPIDVPSRDNPQPTTVPIG